MSQKSLKRNLVIIMTFFIISACTSINNKETSSSLSHNNIGSVSGDSDYSSSYSSKAPKNLDERKLASLNGAEDVIDRTMIPIEYKNPISNMSFWEEQMALRNDNNDKNFERILKPRFGKSFFKVKFAEKNKELVNFLIWIRANPLATYKDLRKYAPVLKLEPLPNKDESKNYRYGDTYVISKYKDVIEVLNKPKLFSVKNYRKKMQDSVGDFMLSYDESRYNLVEKPWMRKLLTKNDLPEIRSQVRKYASELIQKESFVGKNFLGQEFARLELVNQIARKVPALLTQNYFGIKGNDSELMTEKILEWSRATQDDFFHNVVNDKLIREKSEKAGEEMHAYLKSIFALRVKQISEEMKSKNISNVDKSSENFKKYSESLDILSRMIIEDIQVVENDKLKEQERLRTNIIGTLVGGIETTQAAIVQSIDQLLKRPKIFNEAKKIAESGDSTTLAKYIWEALRFNPINPFVLRYVEEDTIIAGVNIPKGSHVLVGTQSAMFDEEIVGSDSELFDINNLKKQEVANTIHLGYGHHRCLGDFISEVQVPEVVMQILKLPNLRRAEGQAGQIDYRVRIAKDSFELNPEKSFLKRFVTMVSSILTSYSTSFPEKFSVEFDSSIISPNYKNAIQVADKKYPYEAYLQKYDRDLFRRCISAMDYGTHVEEVRKSPKLFSKLIFKAIDAQLLNVDGHNRELMYCRMSNEFQSCMNEEGIQKFNSVKDEMVIAHKEAYEYCSKKTKVHSDEDQFYRQVFFGQKVDYGKITGELAKSDADPEKYDFEKYLIFYDRFKTKHSMLNPLSIRNMPESDKILMYTRLNIDFRMCFGEKAILAKNSEKLSREDAYIYCRDGSYDPILFKYIGALNRTERFFYEKNILGRKISSFEQLLPTKQELWKK